MKPAVVTQLPAQREQPKVVHVDDFLNLPTDTRVQYRWINVGDWWYGRRKVKETVL